MTKDVEWSFFKDATTLLRVKISPGRIALRRNIFLFRAPKTCSQMYLLCINVHIDSIVCFENMHEFTQRRALVYGNTAGAYNIAGKKRFGLFDL